MARSGVAPASPSASPRWVRAHLVGSVGCRPARERGAPTGRSPHRSSLLAHGDPSGCTRRRPPGRCPAEGSPASSASRAATEAALSTRRATRCCVDEQVERGRGAWDDRPGAWLPRSTGSRGRALVPAGQEQRRHHQCLFGLRLDAGTELLEQSAAPPPAVLDGPERRPCGPAPGRAGPGTCRRSSGGRRRAPGRPPPTVPWR